MKWLEKNSQTVVAVVVFLLGMTFSTGILWNKVENLERTVEILHQDIHKYHDIP